ncbi:N-acetyltransferase [candidate division KSB1 bacterium]|nr:N-acetyltransferase [candidate division KSB1 bacterium]
MPESIIVKPVSSKVDKRKFILLPWDIYKDDSNWVAPLIMDQKKLLDTNKNPFYQHAQIQCFLAYKSNEIVGRIAAIINDNHNNFHQENTGFFGFFESRNDPNISKALFEAAESWIREKGMVRMRGPVNPSINDTCGLLVDAFDSPPVVMMTYNPSYYSQLFESFGLQKSKDLLAYYLSKTNIELGKIKRVVSIIKKKYNIELRSIDMKHFKRDVNIVKDVYNEAWEKNWGFVPMTDAEMDHMAKELKPIIIPELALFAFINDQPVGFSLSLPDLNQALAKINGRLIPFGLPKILWYSRKIDMIRVIILGIRKKFRKSGIDSLFYLETYSRGVNIGMSRGEFSWILEDNYPMRHTLEKIGSKIYKTYRIFDKEF